MAWKKEEVWTYIKEDGTKVAGWLQDGDKWYYLNSKGIMETGWIQDNSKWYYLYPNTSGTNYKGQMAIGWIKDNNKSYCLSKDGSLYINTTTPDGYKVDANGAWQSSLVSDECINFVKSWEGFYPNKYIDCVGVETQGYGLTGQEIASLPETITEEEASNLLKDWINTKYANVIKADLDSKGITLKQNEFDALVSFAYNCGTGGLLGSTLYKNVCNGVRDLATILSNFQSWSNGGGHRIEGLYRRRTKEGNMFNNADYTGKI